MTVGTAGSPTTPGPRRSPEATPGTSATPALPPSDADLIAASKAGQGDAYATLHERHVAAARGLARQLVRGQSGADDVVAETFAKLLDLLRRGGGPEDAFRPHLLIAVRRTAYDRHRAERRPVVTGDYGLFDSDVPFADPAVEGLERTMIARAYASLAERWQAVLWHTEIEGERPAEVAALLGLSANGVAALAYRAREGLRQAYLQMHLSGVARAGCRPVAAKLGAHVRGGLSKRDAATVAAHLDQCEECRTVLAELGDVNVALKTIIGPLVLGAAAAGYLRTGASGGWLAGRAAWFRHAPRRQQAVVTGVAGAVVAGFAVMALAVAANLGHAAGPGAVLRGQAGGAAAAAPGQAQGAGQRPGPPSSPTTRSPQSTLSPQTTPPKLLPAKLLPAKSLPGKSLPSKPCPASPCPASPCPASPCPARRRAPRRRPARRRPQKTRQAGPARRSSPAPARPRPCWPSRPRPSRPRLARPRPARPPSGRPPSGRPPAGRPPVSRRRPGPGPRPPARLPWPSRSTRWGR